MKERATKILILLLIAACCSLSFVGCKNLSLVEYEMDIISLPDKTEYNLGEQLNVTGLVVRVKNSLTGDEENISKFSEDDRFAMSGYDNTLVGEQTITVTFTDDDYTTSDSFDIEVQDVWADEAKTVVAVADNLLDWYNAAATEYAGGANADDNVEARLYVELGTTKTTPIITPIEYVPNGSTATMYRKYFERGAMYKGEIEYQPFIYKDGVISIAWITLMTSVLPIKVNCYDTIYEYSYPYQEELAITVVDHQYICFTEKPAVNYCYVLDDDGVVSVESIKHILSPVDSWCVQITPGTANDNNVTLIVPGYSKQNITL